MCQRTLYTPWFVTGNDGWRDLDVPCFRSFPLFLYIKKAIHLSIKCMIRLYFGVRNNCIGQHVVHVWRGPFCVYLRLVLLISTVQQVLRRHGYICVTCKAEHAYSWRSILGRGLLECWLHVMANMQSIHVWLYTLLMSGDAHGSGGAAKGPQLFRSVCLASLWILLSWMNASVVWVPCILVITRILLGIN